MKPVFGVPFAQVPAELKSKNPGSLRPDMGHEEGSVCDRNVGAGGLETRLVATQHALGSLQLRQCTSSIYRGSSGSRVPYIDMKAPSKANRTPPLEFF